MSTTEAIDRRSSNDSAPLPRSKSKQRRKSSLPRWFDRILTLRRRLTRSHGWMRLLRLSRTDAPPHAPGVIVIQIDGLARAQLERAVERGRMPFLRRLLKHEHYRLRTMYSGLPSTTPAVQGEIFYGVPQAVPAFGFLPQGAAEPVFMNDPEHAARVEAELETKSDGVLAGGSAQSNIYTGGAAEPRFCAAVMGWGELTKSAVPGARLLFAMAYTSSLLRAFGQAFIELGVGLFDLAQGVLQGRWVRPELRIIPSRVAVGVLLRDAITSCACLDAARGLPVIQLNYLGYDEKAHCRGPSSRLAQHSLRGIDRSIQRIWRAAKRSTARDYEVWIYSDHGQEHVVPYEKLHQRTLQEAVDAIWSDTSQAKKKQQRHPKTSTRARAAWLGGVTSKLWGDSALPDAEQEIPAARAIAIGPLGYLYLKDKTSTEELLAYAARLVREAAVPIVIVPEGENVTHAFTKRGQFRLPEDGGEVLGAEHPFREAAAQDLVKLCRHKDAGQLLICGWRTDDRPVTFVGEHGAHGGAGAEECSAFVLAPDDAPIEWNDRELFRPVDLRVAIATALKSGEKHAFTSNRPRRTAANSVRLMTYNVHSCRGVDGRLSPERIAKVIDRAYVDVVALQELDVMRRRSGQVDQAQRIAELLGWTAYFNPALRFSEEQYGDAILSRFPMKLLMSGTLPGVELGEQLEPRGAIWVELDIDGAPLQVINVHLGLLKAERALQTDALLGQDWLAHDRCRGPAVLCGDFNALPGSHVYRRLTSQLADVQKTRGGRRFGTFYSGMPLLSIDHIFTRGVQVVAVESPRHALVRQASDHLPLVAELKLA